jgi:hypothetical protein
VGGFFILPLLVHNIFERSKPLDLHKKRRLAVGGGYWLKNRFLLGHSVLIRGK